ncbi:NYN domain-containing protein, partial [Candidatus Woesearchaeota archaeon]|nr:NYN domain-containing protein [Candidatus Woesearchaeota archaeon]
MPKHKDQRVGVFVDVQNLYYSAKQFYNSKVNFAHILSRAVSGRQLVRAITYVIKADIKEESNFFEALEKIGFDVRSKDLQTFYGGAKKGDWDVGIAMDIMRMASKLDVIVLVSGDGDFKDLLEHVKALGCRAEVIAFRKTASSRILAEADEFIDLDKELDRVLIKDHKHHNNGQHPGSSIPPRKEYKRPYRKSSSNFESKPRSFDNKPDAVSLIQRLNMEQPELPNLNKTEKTDINVPKPQAP